MRGTFLRENLKISSNYQYVTCRVNDFLGHVFLIPPIQYIIIREAACNQSQLFPFIHDKIFVWIQKKESQGCHTAGNLSTIGFLLYDSALCLDPHMESSLTDFVYRAL